MREAILDAADRLIERYGYKKMTMDDLAQEVGIGKGTIYLYLPSKEEVALSCFERTNSRIQDRLREVARSHDKPADRLRMMLVMRVLLRFDAVQRVARSLDDVMAAVRPAYFERRDRCMAAEAEIFAEVLAEGRALGTFDFDEAVLTAHTLILATNSQMPFSLSPRELGEREEVDAKATRLADMLLFGIRSRQSREY